MKKIVTVLLICVFEVATLKLLQLFALPFRELIYSAVSVFYLLFGCILLKLYSPKKKPVRFLKLMPLRGIDYLLIFWYSVFVTAGSFVLNFLEAFLWGQAGIEIGTNGFGGMSFTNIGEMVLVVALIPAVFEELFFRGAVLSSLEKRGTFFAVAFSSLAFLLMHGSYYYILSTIFAGAVFASAVLATKSVFASMAVHFITNIVSYILYIYSSRLSDAGLDRFIIFGLVFVLLISFYGLLSARVRKVKTEKDNSIKLYNEGELVWETKRKGRKKQGK